MPTIHRNIIKPGQDFWNPPEQDMNDAYGINYGDTVIVPDMPENFVNIHNVRGVKFENENGAARCKYFSLYNKTKDIEISGNGTPGVQHGIVLSSPDHFGTLCETTGNVKWSGVKVEGSAMGLQFSHAPNKTYAAPSVNLTVENCWIDRVKQEAFYCGHDSLGGPYITGNIRNNKITATGRDGIQCRNGTYNVDNNDLDGIGLNGEPYHAHQILFGPGVNGSITNNRAKNGKGYGAFINNRGRVLIKGNSFQSDLASIFIKNYEQDYPYQSERFMIFDIEGNTLTPGNGKALEVLFDPAKDPITINWGVNTYTGELYYQPGVTFNQITTPPPATVVRTGYFTVNNKRKYYLMYSDFTWRWK